MGTRPTWFSNQHAKSDAPQSLPPLAPLLGLSPLSLLQTNKLKRRQTLPSQARAVKLFLSNYSRVLALAVAQSRTSSKKSKVRYSSLSIEESKTSFYSLFRKGGRGAPPFSAPASAGPLGWIGDRPIDGAAVALSREKLGGAGESG